MTGRIFFVSCSHQRSGKHYRPYNLTVSKCFTVLTRNRRETDIRSQPGAVPGGVLRVTHNHSREEQENGAVRVDRTCYVTKSYQDPGSDTVIAYQAKKLDSVLQWLDGSSCNKKHEDVISLRQPDTCTWLPETVQYREWRNTDDSFLWLQGKGVVSKTVSRFRLYSDRIMVVAGAGKTVLKCVNVRPFMPRLTTSTVLP